MNVLRRSGKRRRSASGSDSFSGSGVEGSDSPLLPSGPVLSPPPGLGRCLKDRGRPPAAAAGTCRHSGWEGAGEVGSSAQLRVGRWSFSTELACLHSPLDFYSPSQFVTLAYCGRSLSVRTWTCRLGDSLVIIFRWFVGLSTFTETTS